MWLRREAAIAAAQWTSIQREVHCRNIEKEAFNVLPLFIFVRSRALGPARDSLPGRVLNPARLLPNGDAD
jgi:hypothetical protein